MHYRAEIDGLRALAVLPVLFFHAGFQPFSGGYVGVDVFFVISGYLITTLIIHEIDSKEFTILNFYERRARRLLPALFFLMAVCLPVACILLSPSDLKDFGQSLVSTVTFSSNIQFWWERGYFGTPLDYKPLLHTWSLAVEEQYYIIFPIFLTLAWKMGIKTITNILIVVFLISFVLAHVSSVYGTFDRIITGSFYLLPTRIWEILVGVFVALHFDKLRSNIPDNSNQILSLIGLGMILFSIFTFDGNTPFPSIYSLIPTLGTALVIISSTSTTFVNKFLRRRGLVFLGLISYSTYLWHQPIFVFTRIKMGDEISQLTFFLLCSLSIFLGYLSWKFVEAPFRDKDKVTRNGIFKFSISGILIFILIGSSIALTNGFVKRYSDIEQEIYTEFMNLGLYNPKNMQSIRLNEFDNSDERKKLLIVGDSYAEDLVNAVKESNLESMYQTSSYRIPGNCGVLYIKESLLKQYQHNSCTNRPNFFNEPKLYKLLEEADEVWLSSAWLEWQLKYIKDSLLNLEQINKNIVLFGSKAFDIKSANQYKLNYGEKRLTKRFAISEREKFLSEKLAEITSSINIQYIDSMSVICQSSETCQHSFDGKGIISVDGGHLTPYGASHFGNMLEKTFSGLGS